MYYQELLDVLAQFNLYAWVIAVVASFVVWRVTRTGGWAIIMAGSLLVVVRQLWKFMPGYKDAQAYDLIFNTYMMRYVFGSIGAILLCIGFLMLINHYHELKARLEEY